MLTYRSPKAPVGRAYHRSLAVLLVEQLAQLGILTQNIQSDVGVVLGVAVADDHGDILADTLSAQSSLGEGGSHGEEVHHAVTTVRFEGKPLDEKTLRGVHNYFNIYIMLLTLSVLLVSLDGFDVVTTFTAVATCLNNVGPGLELVCPMGSFAEFSAPVKLLLAFDMLAGRLELYPMLALFAPRLWRKRNYALRGARAK